MRNILFTYRDRARAETPRAIRRALEPVLLSTVESRQTREHILVVTAELLNNIARHGGGPDCSVEVVYGMDHRSWWIEVSDDGPTWPPPGSLTDTLDRPFELHESGRGLALVETLSDEHSYTAEHGMNRTRTAWRIPLRSTRPRILIVDDDTSQCRLYGAYLADHYDTLNASDGAQALEMLKEARFDLVLSDIVMPTMGGLALREELQHDSQVRLMPFVFLTGSNDEDLVSRALAMGIDDYLRKPVSKATLVQTVHRVLERSRQVHDTLKNRLDEAITGALTCRLPGDHPHWQFASFSRNTGCGGGDFIIHRSSGDKLQLICADTMGHDDSAKFFSHAYAGYLRGFLNALPEDAHPNLLLQQFSEAAWADRLFSHVTLTACALTLEPKGRIQVACAGHPPPLLITGGKVRPVNVSGIMPGLVPGTLYAGESLALGAGERLAIYTDGLFDAAPTGPERDIFEQRLLNVLSATARYPIDRVLAAVEALFDEHSGSIPRDDTSFVLIEPAS